MLLKYSETGDEFVDYLNSYDALFHYTRKNIAIENILPNRILKFGIFSSSNDPQEYRPKLTGAVGWGWDDGSNEVSEAMQNIEMLCKGRSRFISFCVNKFENGSLKESGLLKSRMWAQYGDNHEGVCVVLSKNKLLKVLNENKNTHQEILSSDVSYINPERKSQPILHVDQSEFTESTSNDIALKFFLQHKETLLFNKQTDYRDECEFRIVMVNKESGVPDESEAFVPVDDALVGMVFGDRFPVLYSPTVRELVKDSNVIAKKLLWNKDGYHLLDLYR